MTVERSYPVPTVVDDEAVAGDSAMGTSTEAVRTNRQWIQDLSGAPADREPACRLLFESLLRAARAEARRRSAHVGLLGPELDDLAHQAAADALLTVIGKIGSFRGESKFTTWAYKFVIFDVRAKMNRHLWRRQGRALDDEEWDRLPDRLAIDPETEAESRDLVDTVRHAVEETLTPRQRMVFVAVVLNQVPTDVIADRLGSTQNAIYKMIFDTRRKLRGVLVESGHLTPRTNA